MTPLRTAWIPAALASAALATQAAATLVPFATPVELPLAGTATRSVTGGDIDGDGDLDLAVALSTTDEVYWLPNTDGAGTFGPKQSIDTGVDGAWSVLLADLDRDGDLDLVVAAQNEDKVAWYENTDGAGTFGPQQVITTAADFVMSIFVVDLDSDGDLDVLSASQTDNKIAWYENTDGAGTFGGQQVIGTSSDLEQGVSAGDLDGDGDIDVISGALVGTTVGWFENDPGDTGVKGTFGSKQVISTLATGAFSLSAVDLDRDGDLDVISASYSDDELAWYENTDGAGTFGPQQIISTSGSSPRAHVAVDLDGDGDLDLALASEGDNTVAWYEHLDGAGTFGPEQVLASDQNGAFDLFAGDLDGDGDLDLVSAARLKNRVTWYENQTLHRNAAFPDKSIIDSGFANIRPRGYSVAADVDGDGDPDAVVLASSPDQIAWYENLDGAGTFGPQQVIASYLARYIDSADLDGDGDPDLIVCDGSTGEVAWFENMDGAGGFGAPQLLPAVLAFPIWVDAADLDGDGDVDVLVASSNDNQVVWFENTNGQGSFGSQQLVASYSIPTTVTAVDMDRDGDQDALFVRTSGISWAENTDGAGTFGPLVSVSGSVGVLRAAWAVPADLDGDGDIDVAYSAVLDTGVGWFENLGGATSFALAQELDLPAGETQRAPIAAADLDADGDVDLAATFYGELSLVWWENTDGAGIFGPRNTIAIDNMRSGAPVPSDVDRDGRLDLLLAKPIDYEVAWFQNQGGQVAAAAEDRAPAFALQSQEAPLLKLAVTNHGRTGDVDLELASLDLLFEESPADPLTTVEANGILSNLRIYRDEGSGEFGAGDLEVTTVGSLVLTGGVLTVDLPDGDPDAAVSADASETFFVVATIGSNPSAATPHSFRVTHLHDAIAAEYAVNDVPLSLSPGDDTPSSTLVALSLAADEDGDGLSNGDEVNVYGTDPLADADFDGDGLSDADEILVYGTDPLVDGDLDGDGLSDADEVLVHGTDPAVDGDADGDGISDADEVARGMSPLETDTDADGITDDVDNCPSAYNPFQEDTAGFGTPTPDGVGDLCQNGDFDRNGEVDVLDITLQRRGLVGLEPTLDPSLPPSTP